MAAKCGSNFTTFNPNLGWIFPWKDQIVTSFYEQDDALLTTIVEGFHLGLIQQENVYMEFETKGFEGDQPIVDSAVTREIKEEFKRVDYRVLLCWLLYHKADCIRFRVDKDCCYKSLIVYV